MQFNPKALVPLAICLAVMMLILTASTGQSSVDVAIDVAGWGIVAVMSVVAVWKMVRGRHLTPYTQADSMPGRMRRWVLGESKNDRQSGVSRDKRRA